MSSARSAALTGGGARPKRAPGAHPRRNLHAARIDTAPSGRIEFRSARSKTPGEDMKRSLAVVMAGLLLFAAPAAADPVLDLERVTVAELQTKMAAGQLTSVQATRAY